MTMPTNEASERELDLITSMREEDDVARQLSRHAELLPIATGRQTLRFLLTRLGSMRLAFVLMVLTVLAAAIAGAAVPRLIGTVVDVVTAPEGGRMEGVWVLAAVMVGVGVLQAVCSALGQAQVSALGQRLLAGMREDVIDRALDLPAQTMERAGIGDALSRVADDVAVTAKAVTNIVPWIITVTFQITITLVALAMLSPYLLLVVVAILPFYIAALRWFLPRTNRIYRVERIALGARAQGLLSAINGVPTVHAYEIEQRETRHVAALSRSAYSLKMRIMNLVISVAWIMTVPELLAITLVLVLGFFLVNSVGVPVGVVASAGIYILTLLWPLQSLIFSLDDAQSAAASLMRMVGVIVSIDPAVSPGPEEPADGSVELTGIAHSYGQRRVLEPIDLTIEEGETIALVGASGAGKSTLASIIAGTLRPSEGTVRHGGADLSRAQLDAVRAHAVIVSQDVHVFHGTLADDLRLAAPDASEEDLWAALGTVGADSWAELLPHRLDTAVGEKGERLSAEQAQQLALARVALKDPAILVMDEATADEGSSGARVLERAALAVAEGRTTVIVAHRLSQAMHADRILVMADGHVIESGSHADLLAADGQYARLWAAWSR
ncbi:ABC transporter ATP-binding protein [Helcobacillus massiliensis]|uniref:ABC transporter ATP-binding protein n=1 Tax=Helcobacillus massiliensis TaxID=521392 RepID=UPI0025531641|nr:ABC transporter ATP-binding protein [Helcobacillus massiliensis]MDK7742923.1 ABC transporter ATP-binding protein [Helcobacillus massiliensis]WOO92084.1 ABC transporter ATP-binding protein [Helcobacillus massiliensis]